MVGDEAEMNEPIGFDVLADALGIGARSHVAVVGGGGKTTVVHALARRLPGRVVATSTTKMGADQDGGFRVLVDPPDDLLLAATAIGPVTVWSRVDSDKAVGVSPERCDRWAALVDHVVIEADGSKRRPFKAPAWYEPVVPATTTHLVQVIGAQALGRVILDCCHRPLRVAALAGCRPGDRLTPARAAAVLVHPDGALRAMPPGATYTVVVNRIDERSRASADAVARTMRERGTSVIAVPMLEALREPGLDERSGDASNPLRDPGSQTTGRRGRGADG